MPGRRLRSRPEILARLVRIDSVDASVSVHVDEPRGLPPRRCCRDWLELRGESEEALRDVRQFLVSLHVDERDEPGPARPPAVGAIIQIRPRIQAVIGMAGTTFDRLWALATSGQLRYCRLAFTEPRRGSALIVSAEFSSQTKDETADDSTGAPEASGD